MSETLSQSPTGDGLPIPRALPQLTLDNEGPTTVAHPHRGSTLTFVPFDLPLLPQNLTDWCAQVAQRFWIQRRRCLGLVLLLDVRTHEWTAAIPAQRCAKSASCWSAALADFTSFPPETVLGGSFQTRVLSRGEEPADCPPPHDGIHLVQRAGPEPSPHSVWCLARAGGSTFTVEPRDVLFDDVAVALEQAAPRLAVL
jgi:hypothetical protein